jgi:hypothetical protein
VTPKLSEANAFAFVPQDRVMRSVPFHYGWVILLAGGIGSFMTPPGQTDGAAMFFDPLAADLGLRRAEMFGLLDMLIPTW